MRLIFSPWRWWDDFQSRCYITYNMDFRFVPSDLVCFDKPSRCGDGSASGQAGRAGVQPEEDHVIWEPRGQIETESRELRVEPEIRSRSEASLTIRLARGCKRWHLLAPGRRYGIRRSPLSEYISLHLSLKLTTNCVPLSRIKWEIYFIYTYSSLFIQQSWAYNKGCWPKKIRNLSFHSSTDLLNNHLNEWLMLLSVFFQKCQATKFQLFWKRKKNRYEF